MLEGKTVRFGNQFREEAAAACSGHYALHALCSFAYSCDSELWGASVFPAIADAKPLCRSFGRGLIEWPATCDNNLWRGD